jgi:arginine exporter protein ArgO
LINKLDIVLSQQVDYVARSALTQARKKLAVVLFAIYSISLLPMGINGLNIYSGVAWIFFVLMAWYGALLKPEKSDSFA